MSDYEIKGFMLLLLFNMMIAVIVFFWHVKKRQKKKGLIVSLFFVLVPIVGAGLFLAARITNGVVLLISRKEHEVNERELSFSKKRQKELLNPDVEQGINKVSVEEALLMSDRVNKRQVFIDLLKTDDYDNSMGLIKDAVENEDTEIAHFAAAFVTDAQARYKEKEQEFYQKVKESNREFKMEYCLYMFSMLEHDIFSVPERKVYLSHLDEVLKQMRGEEKGIPGEMAARMAQLCSGMGEEREAEWIEIASEYSMSHLDAFKVCLKYYYEMQKKEEFFDLLQRVKESSLALDNEALEWIRFFA